MYTCNKCGARLDAGEACKCGGRARLVPWTPGYNASKVRKKATSPPKERCIIHQIYKRGSDEVIREYKSFDEALKECDIDEYIKSVMII